MGRYGLPPGLRQRPDDAPGIHTADMHRDVTADPSRPAHPADARFGADAVHVLAEAQAQLDRARAASQAQR